MTIFVDIDGTLTTEAYTRWGHPIKDRIEAVKALVIMGYDVVLWSGGGRKYVEAFAKKYGLEGVICIGKPDVIVDDQVDIRPRRRIGYVEARRLAGFTLTIDSNACVFVPRWDEVYRNSKVRL